MVDRTSDDVTVVDNTLAIGATVLLVSMSAFALTIWWVAGMDDAGRSDGVAERTDSSPVRVVDRNWDIQGADFEGTVTIVNEGFEYVSVRHVEVIPKSVARHVDDLDFSVPPDEVIDPDPVVAFDLPLQPGGNIVLTYRAEVFDRASGQTDRQWLEQALSDRDEAEAAYCTLDPSADICTQPIPESTRTPEPEVEVLGLVVISPRNCELVETESATLNMTGTVDGDAAITVDGERVTVDTNGRWSTTIDLDYGTNTLTVGATDRDGRTITEICTILRSDVIASDRDIPTPEPTPAPTPEPTPTPPPAAPPQSLPPSPPSRPAPPSVPPPPVPPTPVPPEPLPPGVLPPGVLPPTPGAAAL